MEKVVFGALGGLAATMAMTVAMRRLWRRLPARERYPLPPREIVDVAVPSLPERSRQLCALLAHFAFGTLAGAAFACLPERRRNGGLYGIFVWGASYLGWLPALNILRPATRQRGRRNLLMIAVHVVWGATLAAGTRELERAAREIFAGQEAPDARTTTAEKEENR